MALFIFYLFFSFFFSIVTLLPRGGGKLLFEVNSVDVVNFPLNNIHSRFLCFEFCHFNKVLVCRKFLINNKTVETFRINGYGPGCTVNRISRDPPLTIKWLVALKHYVIQ